MRVAQRAPRRSVVGRGVTGPAEAAGPAGPSLKPGRGPRIPGGGEGAACLGDRVGGPQEVFQPAGDPPPQVRGPLGRRGVLPRPVLLRLHLV